MVQPKTTFLACAFLVLFSSGCRVHSSTQRSASEADMAGIVRLHHQDVAATVLGDPRLLAELWTDDAVRINPGGRIDVGRAAIHAADEGWTHPGGQVLTYVPEIKDVRIAGGLAYEWGRFTASTRESPTADVKTFRGTV